MSDALVIPKVSSGEFACQAGVEDGVVRFRLSGVADARSSSDFDAFVQKAHAEIQRRGDSEVVVDLMELSFMNSSSFKVFVHWLTLIDELPPEKRYALRFVWDKGQYWQRRSLEALKAFAADGVQL